MPSLTDLRHLEQLGDSLLNTHLRKVIVQVGLVRHLPPVPSLEYLLQNQALTDSAKKAGIQPVSYPYRDSRRRNKAYANGFEVHIAQLFVSEGPEAAESYIVKHHWLPHFPQLMARLDPATEYSEIYGLCILQRHLLSATADPQQIAGQALPSGELNSFIGYLTYSAQPYAVVDECGLYRTGDYVLSYSPQKHTFSVFPESQLPASFPKPLHEEPILRLGGATTIKLTHKRRSLGHLTLSNPWLSLATDNEHLLTQAKALLKNPAWRDIPLGECALNFQGKTIPLTSGA